MKLVVLCGAAGAGKDTVADMLPARKLAFADVLYQEVGAAYNISMAILKNRSTKEQPLTELRSTRCLDAGFVASVEKGERPMAVISEPRSPRQILQWWGDYRRAQDPDYFVKRTRKELIDWDWAMPGSAFVVTDCRFPNEAAMVRGLGAEIWQIQRTGVTAGATGHRSDTDGSEFAPDRIIRNTGSLDDLKAVALAAWGKFTMNEAMDDTGDYMEAQELGKALDAGRVQACIGGRV